MTINRWLADEIFLDFLRKSKDEDIVLYDGNLYLAGRGNDDLDTMVRHMSDPHIPLYVFESYKMLDDHDIQFTVRVINIGGDFAIYERTLGYHPQESNHDGSRREAQPPNQATTFQDLVREGQELRRFFDAQTAQMRVITPNDMKIRSR